MPLGFSKQIALKTFVKCQELFLKLLKCFASHHVALEYQITKKPQLEQYFVEMQICATLFRLRIGHTIRKKKRVMYCLIPKFC